MIYRRSLLNRAFIWLKRFRHRKGYGVQSPLIFHFIREVILQPTPYYEFERLKRLYKEIQSEERAYMLPRRRYELLFRIANDTKAHELIEIGTQVALGAIYLSAARKTARCCILNEKPIQNKTLLRILVQNNPSIEQKQGTLEYLLLQELRNRQTKGKRIIAFNCEFYSTDQTTRLAELLINEGKEEDCIILSGLQRSKALQQAWKKWTTHPRVSISFDLYEAGILFLEPSLPQKCYLINY